MLKAPPQGGSSRLAPQPAPEGRRAGAPHTRVLRGRALNETLRQAPNSGISTASAVPESLGDSCQSSHTPASFSSTGQCLSGFASACDPEPPRRCSGAGGVGGEDPPGEELDSDSVASGDSAPGSAEETETHWGGTHRNGKDVYQLGGELDIEQIERN
ncbi:hypothetical protein ANANG_G00048210 [Anguilla anguilla]|uniref:Uncharacterized protein n=1 Tax=Anguilla anguilla TaxID=7936 RepID=A0A9D3MUU2_ANGAN|nr:hypothetical protein ANANG_G00048210 [Anguilla anguilla]